jgi:sRNA-binding regulator protein Hfq
MNLFTFENITLLIALWGAVLSTAKVLYDYSRNICRLKVYLAYGFLTQGNIVGPDTISISAMNIGYRDVTLNSMGFILPDEKYIMIIEPQSNVKFPYTLSEGKECSVSKMQKQLAKELRKHGYSGKIKLRGYYRSAIGTIFKSKPVDFDIEKALAETE